MKILLGGCGRAIDCFMCGNILLRESLERYGLECVGSNVHGWKGCVGRRILDVCGI
jgi:hypothetical protein